jgi:cytochrome c-type biogenesis protein CcmH/NrfG
MSETTTAVEQPTQPATPTESVAELQKVEAPEERNWVTHLFIGLLAVALVLLVYYAYCRFVANSVEEPMSKGTEQERDDPVIDFNLREAIRELQNMQQRVLNSLSEITNI